MRLQYVTKLCSTHHCLRRHLCGDGPRACRCGPILYHGTAQSLDVSMREASHRVHIGIVVCFDAVARPAPLWQRTIGDCAPSKETDHLLTCRMGELGKLGIFVQATRGHPCPPQSTASSLKITIAWPVPVSAAGHTLLLEILQPQHPSG